MNWEELGSKIKNHIQANHFSITEIKEIYETIPECHFQGLAYRFVQNDKHINLDNNLFWSKSPQGCEDYIKNSFNEKVQGQVIHRQVIGVDLNLLLQLVNKNTPNKDPIINPYSGEEEIMAVKLIP